MLKLLRAGVDGGTGPCPLPGLLVAAALCIQLIPSAPAQAQHNCKGEIEFHKVIPKPGVFVDTHKIKQKPNTYAPMVYIMKPPFTLERRLDGQTTLAKCRKLALHCSRGRHRKKHVRAYCMKTNSKGKFVKAHRLK